ncbi:MAG: DUF402 domain-containing protein [Erysipelotrichaceae bacterium]|nr:DUF402 domain-containing protein [Erysipelotrichaceae bacterium]
MLDKRGWKRLEWKIITKAQRCWVQDENCFFGIVKMEKVSEPFKVGENQLTICDVGITWMQCAWSNVPLWATAMFDQSGKLFQIYFDVCNEVHLDKEDSWFTDLILDVVYDLSGNVIVLDEDELEFAYQNNLISLTQKQKALDVAQRLKYELESHFEDVDKWFEMMYEKAQKIL